MILPKTIFLVKGVGKDKDKIRSYEDALRSAGIAPFNIISVSSILPPGCKFVSKNRGLKQLTPGELIFCVMSKNATNEPHRLIAAAVGVAIPKDPTQYGYLSEYASFGERGAKAGEYAEDLAATMLATTLGVKFDPDTSYDERKEIWKISGKIYRTTNITQTAIGDKNGLWTTVIAAAVMVP